MLGEWKIIYPYKDSSQSEFNLGKNFWDDPTQRSLYIFNVDSIWGEDCRGTEYEYFAGKDPDLSMGEPEFEKMKIKGTSS